MCVQIAVSGICKIKKTLAECRPPLDRTQELYSKGRATLN
ncbi:hypothetical protein SFMTTN_0751 [Sulfuriferula multivorans]|uniref:Uncharacterized protein n=1 Tax=Sulfuriferula multivorans TaxID=1559896 RepID=A0A401JBN3_9PROT|nr:hypothetical protein SFMTTN_0751 [Sulfuriferula multivorans]